MRTLRSWLADTEKYEWANTRGPGGGIGSVANIAHVFAAEILDAPLMVEENLGKPRGFPLLFKKL